MKKLISKTNNSYWIYIFTCLFIAGLLSYTVSMDSLTGALNVQNIINKLVQVFILSSLAWMIGRRLHLNYIWICELGGLGFMLPQTLGIIFEMWKYPELLFGEYSSPVFSIIGPIIAALIIGVVILIISYPLQQLLLNKKIRK